MAEVFGRLAHYTGKTRIEIKNAASQMHMLNANQCVTALVEQMWVFFNVQAELSKAHLNTNTN